MERCPSGLWCRSRKAVSLLASVGSNPTLSAFYTLAYSISRYSFLRAERCWSGRSGAPGERVSPFGDRGFESHPLRFFDIDDCRDTTGIFSINLLIPQSFRFLSCPDTSGRPPTLIIGRSVGRAVGLGAPLFSDLTFKGKKKRL